MWFNIFAYAQTSNGQPDSRMPNAGMRVRYLLNTEFRASMTSS
jgi:hypothetical protein